ncbi:MAG: PQQ-dependent sugar dehydrogenase [Phycisphaerales bacterium]|nr:PQQ-dependent sugar dehydrogenase [Phycisphaerales bacterium]
MKVAKFQPFRFVRNTAILCAVVLIVYLGFLYWHKGQVGLDYRVLNTSLKMPTTPRSVTNWKLRPIEVGGSFKNVTRLVEACDGHLYILEQRGRIYRLPITLGSGDPIRFLKLKNVSSAGEGGLLGLALHPEFGNNDDPNGRYAYVYYSAERDDGTRSNRLSRLTATASFDELDPKSELILIDQDDEHDWHDGGGLTFGPDGFLYLTMGDEGLSSDALGNSQEIKKDLFSGVLRIDVDAQGGEISHWPPRQPETGVTAHYMIPNDNPFVGVPGALEEFYAIGLRNPHDLFFDELTGNGFVTDVGENQQEELNQLVSGGNYEWSFREGDFLPTEGPFNNGALPSPMYGTPNSPLLAYAHTNGNKCIIGGFVYHNEKYPELKNKYIHGDLSSGRVWAATLSPDHPLAIEERSLLTHLESAAARSLCALTTTEDGEIYAATLAGNIYRLEPRNNQDELVSLPQRLSQTGVFADLATLTPAPGFIPYEVKSPLWSDNAVKSRWICVPGDGSSVNPTEDRIYISRKNNWEFPTGTCFIKHFELPIDQSDPTKTKRLETRIIMRDDAKGIYGATYKWNEDDTEALLLHQGQEEAHAIMCEDGSSHQQTWEYPSRIDCLSCHTEDAGYVLGVNTRQLNGWTHYPETRRDGHQLRTWNGIDLITRSREKVKTIRPSLFFGFDALVDPYDASEDLNDRMMSYVDSNCAHCHRPYMMRTALDLRWGADELQRHLYETEAVNPMNGTRTLLVNPANPDASELLNRVASKTSGFRMPPLSTSVPDQKAIELIRQWIRARAATASQSQ